MTLLTLDLDQHPMICDEVVRQTRKYRQRPLAGPIFPPHPKDEVNPEVHLETVQSQLDKLMMTLPRSKSVCQGANIVSSALNDWVARTKAVFHTRDRHWMCSSTCTSTCSRTMVADIYFRVLDEVVEDITKLRDEAYSACWEEGMSEEERDHIRSGIKLRACAVFVSPLVTCVRMSACKAG